MPDTSRRSILIDQERLPRGGSISGGLKGAVGVGRARPQVGGSKPNGRCKGLKGEGAGKKWIWQEQRIPAGRLETGVRKLYGALLD